MGTVRPWLVPLTVPHPEATQKGLGGGAHSGGQHDSSRAGCQSQDPGPEGCPVLEQVPGAEVTFTDKRLNGMPFFQTPHQELESENCPRIGHRHTTTEHDVFIMISRMLSSTAEAPPAGGSLPYKVIHGCVGHPSSQSPPAIPLPRGASRYTALRPGAPW